MSLFIQIGDFKKLAECDLKNFYDSYIDFERKEWQFMQLTNEERDVEVSYFFQFDIAENNDYFEIFHNGMDKEYIQNNILNVLLSEFTDFNYYFD